MIVREIVCWSLSRSYDRCDFPPNCILFASANSRELRWEPFLTNSNFEIIQTQNFFPLLTRDLPIMPREIVVSWMNYNLLVKTFYLQYFDTIQNSPRSLSFFSKTKMSHFGASGTDGLILLTPNSTSISLGLFIRSEMAEKVFWNQLFRSS